MVKETGYDNSAEVRNPSNKELEALAKLRQEADEKEWFDEGEAQGRHDEQETKRLAAEHEATEADKNRLINRLKSRLYKMIYGHKEDEV